MISATKIVIIIHTTKKDDTNFYPHIQICSCHRTQLQKYKKPPRYVQNIPRWRSMMPTAGNVMFTILWNVNGRIQAWRLINRSESNG